ncbi:MAG TPA: 3-carboxy-cis,cis-muconate cycloisomerase [Pyrinomonadaceae bacterium]|nr:3-carboxy-cis,cis-muconate cycloisomerase [Pyrinomonadaceae bacterium]
MIFGDVFGTDKMRAVFDDRSLVQFWLDVEAGLARAQARVGLVPPAAAAHITKVARAEAIDVEALRRGTNLVGYPILPLVRQLSALCDETTAGYIHWGATTQDIMDTACILQLREADRLLKEDLARLIDKLTALARRYRDTPMAGRTHGQHALPITFGYKLAVWVDELKRHVERFDEAGPRLFRVQLGGAAGTLASLGADGFAVHHALAEELNLAPAAISWHGSRDTIAEYVSVCGLLCATLGKLANEVATLQRTEIAEVEEAFERGKGGSSTMPQKRNPNLSENVVGLARLVMQQAPAVFSAMIASHERAMGEWHIEWRAVPETCLLTSAALSHTCTIFNGLVVNEDRMALNLEITNGQIVSEAVMMKLAEHLGRQRAHDLVYEMCVESQETGTPLFTLISTNREVEAKLSETELKSLLDPKSYTGLAGDFVDCICG